MTRPHRPPARAALAALFAALLAALPAAVAHNFTVILGAAIVDGTGAPPRTGHVLVIDERSIFAVVPEREYRVAPGTTLIEADGLTAMPGLVTAAAETASVEARREVLRRGVTAVCARAADDGRGDAPDRPVARDAEGRLAARDLRVADGVELAPGDPATPEASAAVAVRCGRGDDLGTIEVGKLADIVLVEGDPLDAATPLRVQLVFLDGQVAFDARSVAF